MSLGLLNTLCKLLQRVINTIWHVIIGIGDILTNKCHLKSCQEPVMSLRKGYQYRLTPSNKFFRRLPMHPDNLCKFVRVYRQEPLKQLQEVAPLAHEGETFCNNYGEPKIKKEVTYIYKNYQRFFS